MGLRGRHHRRRHGYQMLNNIVGVAPHDVALGMRIRVEFHAVGADLTLPYFTRQK
ncbi:hypothetical protein ACOJVU_06305 [Mycobacterium sp. THU-M104]|uniref:hypothetical protein n=1 Tax=Mycobacterium sp. THU-M104 TaxID=3410515 RepID=UPI003B9C4520